MPPKYELLYPRQTVLVTSWDGTNNNGRTNIITLDWSMPTSIKPFLVAISVGKTRHSYGCISDGREFVVNIPVKSLENAVLLCGTKSGRNCNKFREAGLHETASKKVKPAGILECPARLECVLESEIETGDHVIFVGRVVNAEVDRGKWKPGEVLIDVGRGRFAESVKPLRA